MSDTTTTPQDEKSTVAQETEETKVDEETVDKQPVDEKPVEETKAEQTSADAKPTADDTTSAPETETPDEPVDDVVEVEATSEEPLPDVPEAELPEGVDPAGEPLDDTMPDGDPADLIDQPAPAEQPAHDGSDRPEAHDFTATDGVPDLVDPYDSVDATDPWDSSDDDADAQWGQDSLTDIGVTHETMIDWDVYQDNSNGNTYTDYNDGTFEASVGGQILTGDAAKAAFEDFVNTRLLTPEQVEQLRDHAYDNAPAAGATGGSSSGASATPPGGDVGGGDVGGGDADDTEQMGPPSELAGDGGNADRDGDGEISFGEELYDSVSRFFGGTTSREYERIDKEMGGTGQDTSTRGEQRQGAQEEIDRQDEENKPEEDEKTGDESTDGGATTIDHPGWGDGNRGGVSIFDELKNMPGQRDPRDPGNVDPVDDGYGEGGTDASTTTSADLTQPAGPDAEPSGGGGLQPTPEPIDYGPDHVDPIGSGPYDDDPINIGDGTVSLNQDEPDHHEAPIEMADDGMPEFADLDLVE